MDNILDFKNKFLEKEEDQIYKRYYLANIAYEEGDIKRSKKILEKIYESNELYIDNQVLIGKVLSLLGEINYKFYDKDIAKDFSHKAFMIALNEDLKTKDKNSYIFIIKKYILVNKELLDKDDILYLLEGIS